MKEIMSIAGTALANAAKNTVIQMTLSNGYAALAIVGTAAAFSGAAVAIYAIAYSAKKASNYDQDNFIMFE